MHQPPKSFSQGFRLVSTLAVISAFALITIGGAVRVTNSGLGCPDWPLCHGQIIPPFEFHVLVEYSHRLAASMVSLLVFITGILALRSYRSIKRVSVPASLAPVFLVMEIVLGAITVLLELPPTIVTAHLAIAYTIFALLVFVAIASWAPPARAGGPSAELTRPDKRERVGRTGSSGAFLWSAAAVAATLIVTLSGSYAVGAGAGAVCQSWPLCGGEVLPNNPLSWTHMAHRAIAGIMGIVVLFAGFQAWRQRLSSPGLGTAGLAVISLVVAQVLVGALNPMLSFIPGIRILHLSMATALWGAVVALAALSYWAPPRQAQQPDILPRKSSVAGTVVDYLILTKPRIMLLLLITALGGMVLAQDGAPPLGLMAVVIVGGALASGGASALNNCFDQELDKKMSRTRARPVASERVPRRHAFVFGLVLNLLSFLLLWWGANLASALLAMGGSVFYVLVYTRWLKRSTAQNIVIGGAAGAVPPLVGWAAVTGGINLPAAYLFAIIFFWTPPHFWALALLLRRDYALAGVPMLPVVEGEQWTRWAIFLYVIILNATTLLFYLTTHNLGLFYLGGSIVLGSIFTFYATQLLYNSQRPFALRLYKYSLLYLALLFVVIMADRRL